ncbi:MAG: carbon-nitrogen hydrolase family protein [Rhodobacteraceae bacterium]|nr:carbon-nitrogen hydrolase family protein [Paracoccaceae bacterium]
MKIATAAYPLDWLDSWSQYEDKLSNWVGTAAAAGADLLTFPEYGAMELASLAGTNVAGDVEQSICAVSERIAEADQLHQKLAAEHQVYILAASAPIYDPSLGPRPINRARLITPGGHVAAQDKQIMTRYERNEMDVVPGNGLQIFDTTLGRIGVLICYDSEFPLLGRALSEADVILAPSCTEALSGYWRVRIGSMARALENQCVTAMASLVGAADWCPAVDMNTGMGGVFGPPDKGFPATGVLAEGSLNQPGWTYAEVDLSAIAEVRADGHVLNRAHWDEQMPRLKVTRQALT